MINKFKDDFSCIVGVMQYNCYHYIPVDWMNWVIIVSDVIAINVFRIA